MGHTHSVYDTDTHFVIAKDTREIKLESTTAPVIVQHDHNSERFSFELPRYIDGHDMTLCNEVQVHYLNIDSSTKDTAKGVYTVEDIGLLEGDANTAVCSWLISENATQFAGKLNFMIRFACLADDGTVLYRWNTGIYTDLTVVSGYDNGEAVTEDFPDILAQWKAELFGIGDTEEQRLLDVSAEQQAAIAAEGQKQIDAIAGKGAAVNASIPADYSALSALADHNRRNKAGAIVLDAEGESIVLNDASEYPLQGLKLFGKSTQDGEPSPEYPQEIHSVENAVVRVSGKNLLEFNFPTATNAGITYTVNSDGSVTINGTATEMSYFTFGFGNEIPVYDVDVTISLGNNNGKVTLTVGYFKENGETVNDLAHVVNGETTFSYPREAKTTRTFIVVSSGAVCNNLVVYPTLRVASTTSKFEKTKPIHSMAIPRTLPGIPVSSGGNYTDANGQQWICDEVDLARGVYVQRIYTIELSGTENFVNVSGDYAAPLANVAFDSQVRVQCICNYFPAESRESVRDLAKQPGTMAVAANWTYLRFVDNVNYDSADVEAFKAFLAEKHSEGNPVTVKYILATPIETPLSDAEITAYKALYTNKPNTTILNDAGACMAVEYVADTKTYIDHKIAELMAQ